jgi:hypothetical protein
VSEPERWLVLLIFAPLVGIGTFVAILEWRTVRRRRMSKRVHDRINKIR